MIISFKQLHFFNRYDKILKIFFYVAGLGFLEKLVVKTAVKTVLILLGIVVVAFAVVNFAFPQYMATVSESMGNYDLALKYASLRIEFIGI